MKGGHASSGPAPDPNALRRERASDAAGWTTLPAEGRKGAPPDWPLEMVSGAEADFWIELWRKPQAVEWERLGLELEVAIYCRRLAEAVVPGSPVAAGTLVKQLGEQLGLTMPGMRMLRWKIGPAAADQTRAAARPAAPARVSSRDRFRVIDGDATG